MIFQGRDSGERTRHPDKKNPPACGKNAGGRREKLALNFLFLLARKRGLGSQSLGGALLEFIHATGGIHKLLLARVKRMADVANANDDRGLGGTRLDYVATGATNLRVHIFWMYVRLHKNGRS
jgi:hypothetical protein